jgi:hypothetical protein
MTETFDFDDIEPSAPPPEDVTFPSRPARQSSRPGRSEPVPASIDRSPPHSTEAENHVLACCLVDGSDTMARCVENGVTEDCFYSPANRFVFSVLLELHKSSKLLGLEVLVEELMRRRTLEAVGGMPCLMAMITGVVTTAHAGYFIDQLKDYSLRREIIKQATALVEQSYSGVETATLVTSAERLAAPLIEKSYRRAPVRPVTDFLIPPDGDKSILLGNRYLCRGDGAVMSGGSGMGKSSMQMQQAILWGLGRPAFGIQCNGRMKSLIIQSEDSDGDVAEMWHSVSHALKLQKHELEILRDNVVIVTDRVNRGTRFITALKRLIAEIQPDLVWINPLQAFIDGDVTDSQDIGAFLREGLNGLNEPASFAYILVHHTTKPATGKDKAERLWHEVMYDMAGGAEIINWARAILSLRAKDTEGDFDLVLAKRGKRAGVTREVEQGAGVRFETITTIPLKHAQGTIEVPGRKIPLPLIFWEPRDVANEPVKTGSGDRKSSWDFAKFRPFFPNSGEAPLGMHPLHRKIVTTIPISSKALFSCLNEWAESGLVIRVQTPEDPTAKYRLAGVGK